MFDGYDYDVPSTSRPLTVPMLYLKIKISYYSKHSLIRSNWGKGRGHPE